MNQPLRLSLCLLALLAFAHARPSYAAEAIQESPITDADREHWAFQPIKRTVSPTVRNSLWVNNGIDAFILAKLEQRGFSPAPSADRATLLRRLSFDLIGLPPTPAELQRFLNNTAPDAFEREVDRLLASPAYGEREAQIWLDLARFAESDGFEHDKVRPDAWKYRDWVIDAFNRDLPYDRFVRAQLAGDLLKEDAEPIATMFCLSGPDMPDINDQAERRHVLLNELTATVSSVFLGLQLGCAQCHDHKYDPLSQADFYRLRAVFETAIPKLQRDVPYNALQQQREVAKPRLWIRGDHRRPGAELEPGFPRIASVDEKENVRITSHPRLDLADWLVNTQQPLTARVIVNRVWQQHFGRGLSGTPSDFGLLGTEPTHPELLDWLATELRAQGWSLKRLHRLIVCSATYQQASRATPLDATWHARLEQDPNNKLYSRFPRQRLTGEMLRDAMLTSAGLLVYADGGPGVFPPLAEELKGTLLKDQWTTSKRIDDHYRRSVYVFARRNLRFPMFDAFGRPAAEASCAVRYRSTTATQSLLLLNSEFCQLMAQHVAGRALADSPDQSRQIEFIYAQCLSRALMPAERAEFAQFLDSQTRTLREDGRPATQLALPLPATELNDPYAAAALVDACLAILNTSEFIYLD